MPIDSVLFAHLRKGATNVCRCWRVTRTDGRILGFTDHDMNLAFDGTEFRANDGLSARNIEQTTGLAVDNSEAMGVLSTAGVTEEDIATGRYDGAKVEAWLVNWADTSERHLLFAGEIGEIQRAGGAFKAELRGLTEALNQTQGRTYQKPCAAILGDASCRVDLADASYSAERDIVAVENGHFVDLGPLSDYRPRWFERGRLVVLSGPSAGDVRLIKNDTAANGGRRLELWEALRGTAIAGNRVRIEAGCDKKASTCRAKFANIANFQGFPHLPGEDFLMAYPVRGEEGGSMTGTTTDGFEDDAGGTT